MSIVKEDLLSISPDALAPAATEAKAEAVGVTKASMGGAKCFVSAMLAGARNIWSLQSTREGMLCFLACSQIYP